MTSMDVGNVTFEFALFGEVLEPRAGVVAVDVGSTCVAGVIDHHFAEAGDECAATLVVNRGEELVLNHLDEAPGEGLTIVVHREPDLDAVVAAYLTAALVLDGGLPNGAEALAEYARIVDSGKLPPDGLEQTSLWALYTAATHLLSSENDHQDEHELYRAWLHRGFDLIVLALESEPSSVSDVRLPEDLYGFEDEWAFLTEERGRYREDRDVAETFPIFLPINSGEYEQEVTGLRIRSPRSSLFTQIACAEGYPITHVIIERPPRDDESTPSERHLITVSPESGFWLRGLGMALERLEVEARAGTGRLRSPPPRWPDVTNSDPWYDGRSPIHAYTIVDTPDSGTVLTAERVIETLEDTMTWIELGRPIKEILCPKGCRFPSDRGASYCPFHADKLMPALVDGRYEVEAVVAEGGMGSVWKVRDLRTSIQYALKRVLQQHMGREEVWSRFRREGTLASRVAHPNVVRHISFATSAETGPYIISEFVDGTDLRRDIEAFQKRREWYPWLRIKSIMLQSCHALAAVHNAGVLHRDLKPENIMLKGEEPGSDTDDPEVKILDFGLSILNDPNAPRITAVGIVSGTTEYAAPEQMKGGQMDERADLYALGSILFELLSFEQPFMGYERPMDVAMAKIAYEAPKLPHNHPRLEEDDGLEDLIVRLLAKEKEPRPSSAGEVAQLLEEL